MHPPGGRVAHFRFLSVGYAPVMVRSGTEQLNGAFEGATPKGATYEGVGAAIFRLTASQTATNDCSIHAAARLQLISKHATPSPFLLSEFAIGWGGICRRL